MWERMRYEGEIGADLKSFSFTVGWILFRW
jgi:hypothetical protein